MDMGIDLYDTPKWERTKLSPSQFGLMVDFLSLHPDLITGKTSEISKEALQRKWEELAAILNSDGTGARKSVGRWKKSWSDIKCSIKNKVKKLNTAELLPGCERQYTDGKLSELEEKAWNLVKSNYGQKKLKSHIVSVKKSIGTVPSNLSQELEEARYIIVNVDGSPLTTAQIDSNNIFFDLETSSGGRECTSNILEQLETTNSVPEATNDVPDNSEATNDVPDNSGAIHDTRIKSEPEHTVVSETSVVSPVSKEACSNQEIILVNQSSSHEQNSNNTCPKRLKVQSFNNLRKRRANGIIPLLQRQNELLECIAASVARIETSLETTSSQYVQRKNAIGNIVENIDKIAGSLGSVSKSLKKISGK